jgi:hypothetical protein
VAFLGNRKGLQVIGLDDTELKTYGSDLAPGWPLAFSADGSIVAFSLNSSKGDGGRIVVNGAEGPKFDFVGHPSLSRDGRVIAYSARKNDSWFVRIGEREGPVYDVVTDPVVSGDGSVVAYAAEDKNGRFLHVGDKRTPLQKLPVRIFMSSDGKRVGWVVFESLEAGGSKMRVVAFGETGPPFGIVGTPVFSPTEDIVAYAADDANKRYVIIGAKKIETPDRIGDPVFSSDGRKVGYGARIGRELWWKVLETR